MQHNLTTSAHPIPIGQNRAIRLLLHFLSIPVEEQDFNLMELSDADWEQVLRLSARHGVAGLLYHRFQQHIARDATLPTWVLPELRAGYLNTALRNMRLYRELYKILMALAEDEIPVIV